MGADCCGGDPSPAMAALSVADAPPRAAPAAAPTVPSKSHAEYAAELQAYVAKRISLFEQYRAREEAKVRELWGRGAEERASRLLPPRRSAFPPLPRASPSHSRTLPPLPSIQIEAAKAAAVEIDVTMPDGSVKKGVAGVTTPFDIALSISKSLAKAAVVAKVRECVCVCVRVAWNEAQRGEAKPAGFLFLTSFPSPKVDGAEWDLTRPLTTSCTLHLATFDDPDGKHAFWHSSAHVFGEALEQGYGVKLTIGPPVEEGFYYDCYMDGARTLTDADFGAIDKRVAGIVKEAQQFQRVEVSREEARAMFEENKFKVEIIDGLPADATITLYRCGPMVDLCSGPHLPHTGYLKAAKTTAASAAFWRGDAKNAALQRVYGVTFPDKASLADYEHRMAEAKRRDHRVVGTAQDLTLFHPLSPGSAFFMPAGARIYNALMDYIRGLYWEHEFDEVVTPNLYNFDLWTTSGHAAHYKENMFCVDVEKQEFGLKPMNCPGHCLLYAARARSYRDLPLRMADFGVLHRNEYSGALSGLTRVRRFQQDDAHIFCRPDQVSGEGLCVLCAVCMDVRERWKQEAEGRPFFVHRPPPPTPRSRRKSPSASSCWPKPTTPSASNTSWPCPPAPSRPWGTRPSGRRRRRR